MSWFAFNTLRFGKILIQAADISAAWVKYEIAGYSRSDCISASQASLLCADN